VFHQVVPARAATSFGPTHPVMRSAPKGLKDETLESTVLREQFQPQNQTHIISPIHLQYTQLMIQRSRGLANCGLLWTFPCAVLFYRPLIPSSVSFSPPSRHPSKTMRSQPRAKSKGCHLCDARSVSAGVVPQSWGTNQSLHSPPVRLPLIVLTIDWEEPQRPHSLGHMQAANMTPRG
jgi:hypothetical protein